MATIEIWIQLENRSGVTMPNNIDRMTCKTAQGITGKASKNVIKSSLGTGVTKTRTMFAPLLDVNAPPPPAKYPNINSISDNNQIFHN